MHIHILLGKLLKKLKVKRYQQVAFNMVHDDYYFFDKLLTTNFDIKKKSNNEQIITTEHSKIIKYSHRNRQYIFELNMTRNENMSIYAVNGQNGNSCIVFFIDHNDDFAFIDSASYFNDFAREGLSYPGNSTVLFM